MAFGRAFWFLDRFFIKKYLGNNEARYRRYKANCAVCKVDSSGTHCMGLYGKIRSWKAVAILQMLEKQMGLESFRRVRFLGISQLVLLNSALLIMFYHIP
ncbi:hypothetical protein S245_030782 [Arachis hypogaea]